MLLCSSCEEGGLGDTRNEVRRCLWCISPAVICVQVSHRASKMWSYVRRMIINPPQSGILGMHNIVERPIVKDGQIVVAPVMYVALSYDHRIIDGREYVGFLVAVKEAIENPVELLMDGDIKKALEL